MIIPGNLAETLAYSAEHLIEHGRMAIAEKDSFRLALSGGSTPKAIYQLLATTYREALDWNKVSLFWGDERAVPPTDPQSNYKMAMEAGFASLGLPSVNIHRMKAEDQLELHAQEYAQIIDQKLDYIMLGMGEDGHTASLFPGTEALNETVRWVVPNWVPTLNVWRMTLTFPALASTLCVFTVTGKNKAACLKEVLTPGCTLPAARVKAEWIVDADAGH